MIRTPQQFERFWTVTKEKWENEIERERENEKERETGREQDTETERV